MLSLLICVPLLVYAILFSWDLGYSLCKLFVFVAYCCTFSSLLTILLMSVQRYYQVLNPSAGSGGVRGVLGGGCFPCCELLWL